MPATRILWGQILVVGLVVLACIWGATQWTAASLAYQPGLGHPWTVIFGRPVYQPFAFFYWWFAFDAYAPAIFIKGAAIAASGGILSVVFAIAMSVWRAREAKIAQTYGSARWATDKEVSKAGCLARPASCWACSSKPIFAMTDPSTFCVSRQRAAARALALLYPRF